VGVTRTLTEGLGVEGSEVIIFHSKADLNWFAAYLAIFDVGLTSDGQVQEHRNLFTTIGAVKFVFHSAPGLAFLFPRLPPNGVSEVIYLECPMPDRHDPGRFLTLLGNSEWTKTPDR
jgi:hypothetical protein